MPVLLINLAYVLEIANWAPDIPRGLNYLIVSTFEVHGTVEITELPASRCKSIFPEGQKEFVAFSIC